MGLRCLEVSGPKSRNKILLNIIWASSLIRHSILFQLQKRNPFFSFVLNWYMGKKRWMISSSCEAPPDFQILWLFSLCVGPRLRAGKVSGLSVSATRLSLVMCFGSECELWSRECLTISYRSLVTCILVPHPCILSGYLLRPPSLLELASVLSQPICAQESSLCLFIRDFSKSQPPVCLNLSILSIHWVPSQPLVLVWIGTFIHSSNQYLQNQH